MKRVLLAGTAVVLALSMTSCSLFHNLSEASKEAEKKSRQHTSMPTRNTEETSEEYVTTETTEDPNLHVCDSVDEADVFLFLQEAVDNKWDRIRVKKDVTINWIDFKSLDYGAFWLENLGILQIDDVYDDYYLYYHDYDDEKIERMKAEIDESSDYIISCIPEGADEWESALVVHDELIKMCTGLGLDADSTDENSDGYFQADAYGPLGVKKATCCGYTSAFVMIMNRIGIPCRLVESENHAWVWMGDDPSCGYIDVFWDDYGYVDTSGEAVIGHIYFGMTDEEQRRIGDHEIEYVSKAPGYVEAPIDSYYEHEGYYMEDYSFSEFCRIAKEEYNNGMASLEIKMADEDDYIRCKNDLNDGYTYADFLWAIQYNDDSYELTSQNEGIYVIIILLNIDNDF